MSSARDKLRQAHENNNKSGSYMAPAVAPKNTATQAATTEEKTNLTAREKLINAHAANEKKDPKNAPKASDTFAIQTANQHNIDVTLNGLNQTIAANKKTVEDTKNAMATILSPGTTTEQKMKAINDRKTNKEAQQQLEAATENRNQFMQRVGLTEAYNGASLTPSAFRAKYGEGADAGYSVYLAALPTEQVESIYNSSGGGYGGNLDTGTKTVNEDKKLVGDILLQKKDKDFYDGIVENGDKDKFDRLINLSALMYSYETDPDSGVTGKQNERYRTEYDALRKELGDRYGDFAKTLENYKRVDAQEWKNGILGGAVDFIERHPVIGGVTMTAASVLSSPVRGLVALKGYLDEATGTDTYGVNTILNDLSSTVTSTVGDNIKSAVTNRFGKAWGTVAGWIYSAGVSSLESALVMSMGGYAGEAVFFANASSETYQQALERGLDMPHAIATAAAAGVAEVLFEHLSLDRLRDLAAAKGHISTSVIMDLLTSAGIEGSEELFTDAANALGDWVINGGASEFNQNVREYMAQGMTEEEARRAAAKDLAAQMGESFIVGAMSGGMGAANISTVYDIANIPGDIRTGAAVKQAIGTGKLTTGDIYATTEGLGNGYAKSAVGKLKNDGSNITSSNYKTGKAVRSAVLSNMGNETARRVGEIVTDTQIVNAEKKRIARRGEKYKPSARFTERLRTTALKNASEEDLKILTRKNETAEQRKEALAVRDKVYSDAGINDALKTMDAVRLGNGGTLASAVREAAGAKINNITDAKVTKYEGHIKKAQEEYKAIKESGDISRVPESSTGYATDTGRAYGITDGGEVIIDKSGASAPMSSVNFTDEESANLFAEAGKMVSDGKITSNAMNAFLSVLAQNTDLDIDLDERLRYMAQAYEYGKKGADFDLYLETITGREASDAYMYLGDSEIRFALDLGRDNFKAEPGVTRIGVRRTLSKKQENQLIAIDAFAKKYGLTIIVTPKLYANGQTLREFANGVENGKVIILSLAAEDNALTVAAFHEAFHKLSADVKTPLINDMIRQLITDEGENFRNIFYQRYALYNTTTAEDKASLKETLKELDFDGDVMAQLAELFGEKELADTYEEIAAQYAGTLLSRDDVLAELAEKNPTGLKKFVEEIKKFLTEVKNYIAYLAKHDETAAAALRKDAKEAAELAERIADALEKAEFGTESGAERYSLQDVEPVMPKSALWKRTLTTAEAMQRFPDLWNVTADESEVRNPTQVQGTVSTYRKIYDILAAENFSGTILDASSGLGYGTRADREEYGYDVDDIEPYPDKSYKPRYTDYSALNKTYDVIISNAVLNVLPQDQRDALTVKMGQMLNPGGRMFVNVRKNDVMTAKSKVVIDEDNWEVYISDSGSYQKGFRQNEIVSYMQDALGDDFIVEPTKKFGGMSVIVTKKAEVKYSKSTADRSFYPSDSIDRYTEKEYNDRGWVAVNHVITGKELKKLYSLFAEIKRANKEWAITSEKEYIIPVGDKFSDIDHLVYIRGTIKNPEITKVVTLINNHVDDELKNIYYRSVMYFANEYTYDPRGSCEAYFQKQLFTEINRENYESYSEQRKNSRYNSRSSANREGDSIGGRSGEEDTGSVKKSQQTTDAEYMDAVERGDMETTQRMVDEAAIDDFNEENGLSVIDTATESASPARFSLKTWNESDYVVKRREAAEMLAASLGVSKAKATKYLRDIDSVAKMIADDRARLDYESSPGRSAFVSNSEYGGSIDFSTLCKKRRLLTGTFSEIQKLMPDTVLSASDILMLRNMMKEKGYEVSCGLCYVEGSRAQMGKFAAQFIERYKKHNPGKWYPNLAEINTPDGIEWVRINHPEVYEQYEKFWNNKGVIGEGDTVLFASQQKPKLYQLRTEYKNEILKYFSKESNVKAKNENGGLRLQSFSDFEIAHLIDTMQVLLDMSTVGLAGQAYTKVPEFAWAFGGTGLKINLSLISKGVDENGKLIFDDVEGMPHDTAFEIRNAYSDNVGTILVVFDDAQLKAAMADERIDFIIPFHRSQWKKAQYNDLGLPSTTKDFTYVQNEKYTTPHYHEYQGRMVKDKAANYMPNTYWDFNKSGKENAETYLRMCFEDGKRPKFYKLLDQNADGSYSLKADGSTDGYWKLLIDFKMYNNEGVGSPQMPVKPTFNIGNTGNELLDAHSIQTILNRYTGGHQSFPVARDIVDEFVAMKQSVRQSKQTIGMGAEDVAAMTEGNEEMETQVGVLSDIATTAAKGIAKQMLGAGWNRDKAMPKDEKLNDIVKGALVDKEDRKALKVLRDWTKDFLWRMYNGAPMDMETAMSELTQLVKMQALSAGYYEQVDDSGKELRQRLKGTKIYLQNEALGDIRSAYGSVQKANREVYPWIILTTQKGAANEGATSLDVLYDDLLTEGGYALTEEARQGGAVEMLRELSSILRSSGEMFVSAADVEGLTGETLDEWSQQAAVETLAKIYEVGYSTFDKNSKIAEKIKTIEEIRAKMEADIRTQTEQAMKAADERVQRVIDKAAADAQTQKTTFDLELQAEKERSKAALEELAKAAKTRYEERTRKARERREEADSNRKARAHIIKTADKIRKLLLNETDEKHVPEDLKNNVLDFLELMTFDGHLWGDAELVISRLASSYEDIRRAEESKDGYYNPLMGEYDADIAFYVSQLKRFFENKSREWQKTNKDKPKKEWNPELSETRLPPKKDETKKRKEKTHFYFSDLSTTEIAYVRNITDHVYKLIKEANETVLNGKKARITELGQTMMAEAAAHKAAKIRGDKVEKAKSYLRWKNAKPVYAFKKLGGVAGRFFEDFRDAQDLWFVRINEGHEKIEQIKEETNYESWKNEKTEFVFHDGWNVVFDKEAVMQIYATFKREMASGMKTSHIQNGGIVLSEDLNRLQIELSDKKLKEKIDGVIKDSNGHPLSLDDIAQIANSLTDEQKKYVDSVVAFLSTTAARWGNEASMELVGIPKYTEKYYFPFQSSKNYLYTRFGVTDDTRLKHTSFTNRTQQDASTPLTVSSFTDVAAGHIQQMAMYSAFVNPIENFTRVHNYQDRNAGTTVKTALDNAYGKGVNEYIDAFMKAMNGGMRSDNLDDMFSKGTKWFKRAAVMANLSVVIQQPSAVGRAFAVINPKYFRNTVSAADYREMLKYNPIAGIKKMGGFDTGIGVSAAEWIAGGKNYKNKISEKVDRVSEFMGVGAEFADNMTWTGIWNACKRETRELHPDVAVGSEEFFKIASGRFRDVIEYTQVYDSTLTKSELMRGKGALTKMITAFMAEPTTSYNLLFARGQDNTINTGRAVTAFVLSTMLNAALKSLVVAMRDDDDDYTYLEKYIASFVGSLTGSKDVFYINSELVPINLIPWAKDIISLLQGFDIERSDMAAIADFITAANKLLDEFGKNETTGEWEMPTFDEWKEIFIAASAFTPLPIKSVVRDGEGLYKSIRAAVKRTMHFDKNTLRAAIKAEIGFDSGKPEKAYYAVLNGEKETEARMTRITTADIKKYIADGYTEEEAEQNAIVAKYRQFHKYVVEGMVQYNDDIVNAAEAKFKGKTGSYEGYVNKLKAQGFTQNDIVTAVDKLIETKLRAPELEAEEMPKGKDLYKMQDAYDQFDNRNLSGFKNVKAAMIEAGIKDEKSINSSMKSRIKGVYEAGTMNTAQTAQALIDYAGMTDAAAKSQASAWEFELAYPDSTLDEKDVKKFYEELAPQGITLKTYEAYYDATKGLEADVGTNGKTISGSKKEKVLKAIDDLPITNEQKDVFYYYAGYKTSTISDCPWH